MEFELLLKKLSPVIKRIAYRLSRRTEFFNEEDLYQEATIYLWEQFAQDKTADKTDSYLLQGCFFHLQNYLRTHRNKLHLVSDEYVRQDGWGQEFDSQISRQADPRALREELHAHMLIEQIRNNGLTLKEKEVFNFSLEGLTTREIGSRLGVSHVMVVKLAKNMRRKISKHMDAY